MKNVFKACLVFAVIYICAGLAMAGTIYSKTVFMRDVEVGIWTAVDGMTSYYTTNGIYTNSSITYSNYYRMNATNDLGRLPVSTVVTSIWVGVTNQSNAVVVTWDEKLGINDYVLERSFDGSTWTQWLTVAKGATNYTDYGTQTWTMTMFTNVFSEITSPSVPWPGVGNQNYQGFDITNAGLIQARTGAFDTLIFSFTNITWGSLVGSISNQTDLITVLSNYYLITEVDALDASLSNALASIVAASTDACIQVSGDTIEGALLFDAADKANNSIRPANSNDYVVMIADPSGSDDGALIVVYPKWYYIDQTLNGSIYCQLLNTNSTFFVNTIPGGTAFSISNASAYFTIPVQFQGAASVIGALTSDELVIGGYSFTGGVATASSSNTAVIASTAWVEWRNFIDHTFTFDGDVQGASSDLQLQADVVGLTEMDLDDVDTRYLTGVTNRWTALWVAGQSTDVELVVNGTFSNANDWAFGGDAVWNAERVEMNSGQSGTVVPSNSITLVEGSTYQVRIRKGTGGATNIVRLGGQSWTLSSAGSNVTVMTCIDDSTNLVIEFETTVAFSDWFDNVSVARVTNGSTYVAHEIHAGGRFNTTVGYHYRGTPGINVTNEFIDNIGVTNEFIILGGITTSWNTNGVSAVP